MRGREGPALAGGWGLDDFHAFAAARLVDRPVENHPADWREFRTLAPSSFAAATNRRAGSRGGPAQAKGSRWRATKVRSLWLQIVDCPLHRRWPSKKCCSAKDTDPIAETPAPRRCRRR